MLPAFAAASMEQSPVATSPRMLVQIEVPSFDELVDEVAVSGSLASV